MPMHYDEEQENYYRRTKNGTWDEFYQKQCADEQLAAAKLVELNAAILAARKQELGDNYEQWCSERSKIQRQKIAERDAAFEANPAYVKRRNEIIAQQPGNEPPAPLTPADFKKRKVLNPETKRQRMLDAKREMFARYHKKSGSDFWDH